MRTLTLFVPGIMFLAMTASHAADTPAISLPDLLAVELPKGVTQIGPTDSPLRELLNSAHDASKKISFDLKSKVGVGPLRVTWSAWDGSVGIGKPAATRTERVFVFPFGMTPVGVYGGSNGTAGNNAVHITRDNTGRVHMVWQDGGRPRGRTGPVYRRAVVNSDGTVRFETGPIYIADNGPSDWNARPALAASGSYVELVWQGGGTARTRRVSFGPDGWIMGPVTDTGAKSEGGDVGDSVAIDDKGGIHIATPSGIYSYSGDGGKSWRNENIPIPPGESIKTQSLAVDSAGVVHIAFTAPMARDNSASGAADGYWQLRTIDRTPDGRWINPADVLGIIPGWQAPKKGTGDVLADWVRIAADRQGGLHLTWHGTYYSRKFGNDSSFYAFKKAGGDWSSPVRLVPQTPGIRFSYAPSLTLVGDRAFALTFYEGVTGADSPGFDSRLVPLRNGRVDGPPIPVTQFVSAAISAKHPEVSMGPRFPGAAPNPWRTPDGRTGLDILELIQSPFQPNGPSVVIYQRLDLTAALRH